jgi:hypothetical protein
LAEATPEIRRRTRFNKVNAFWLGPAAFDEFKAGRRMVTMGIRSPREYDLAES